MSSQPSLQYPTREFLNTNFHKSDLQKRCRELGLTKVWVNKEQLIDMIMANTPITEENNTRSDYSPHGTQQLHPVVTVPGLSPCSTPPISATHHTPALYCTPTLPHIPTLPHSPNSSHTPNSPHTLNSSHTLNSAHILTSPFIPTSPHTSPPRLSPGPQTHTHSPNITHTHVSTQALTSSTLPHGAHGDKTEIDVYKMALDIENIKAKLHTKDLEIDLLNTEVKTAFETITALQQRVDDLEQKLCPNSREQPQAPNNNPLPPHCLLLLGDINLRRVLRSDLGENCSVYNNMTSQTLLSRQPPRHSDYPLTARQPPPNMQIPGAAPRLSPGPAPRGTASLRHPSSSEYHTAAPRPRTEAPWAHVARRDHHAPEGAAVS
ncbi:hypothetical protein Pcinc_012629 [Petrolisthes cinctipes]|uniref:Uncharacterized protein n=1 Tax=Petrolisthes cinctipes TaxID=88211 RepID=A0AAE1G1D6_PETCI|nr:hypothetical protein Pcinc_012629 [Petrolisthes cinctipes]